MIQTQLALKIQKTYSQKDVDQLLECTKMENITDRRNFETHIQNQYISEIENLKAEHQEQIDSIETKIAEKMQNEIKNIQATSDKQIAKYVESIQLLQQKIQTLQQSNLNTPHMPHHNQPMNNESLASDKIENEQYQNIRILVAKLFTIYTGTISGSYAISWLEYRQTI